MNCSADHVTDRSARLYLAGTALVLTLVSVLVAKASWRGRQSTRSKTEISQLKDMQTRIAEVLIAKKGKYISPRRASIDTCHPQTSTRNSSLKLHMMTTTESRAWPCTYIVIAVL